MVLQALYRIVAFALLLTTPMLAESICCCDMEIELEVMQNLDAYTKDTYQAEADALTRIAEALQKTADSLDGRTAEIEEKYASKLEERGIGGDTLYDALVKVRAGNLYYKVLNTGGFERLVEDMKLVGAIEAQTAEAQHMNLEQVRYGVELEAKTSIADDLDGALSLMPGRK